MFAPDWIKVDQLLFQPNSKSVTRTPLFTFGAKIVNEVVKVSSSPSKVKLTSQGSDLKNGKLVVLPFQVQLETSSSFPVPSIIFSAPLSCPTIEIFQSTILAKLHSKYIF